VHWAGEALIAETDTWESAEALDTSTAVLATSDTAIQFSGNPLDGNDVATASTTISNSGNPVSARPAWSTDAEDLNNEWPEDWPDEESNATEWAANSRVASEDGTKENDDKDYGLQTGVGARAPPTPKPPAEDTRPAPPDNLERHGEEQQNRRRGSLEPPLQDLADAAGVPPGFARVLRRWGLGAELLQYRGRTFSDPRLLGRALLAGCTDQQCLDVGPLFDIACEFVQQQRDRHGNFFKIIQELRTPPVSENYEKAGKGSWHHEGSIRVINFNARVCKTAGRRRRITEEMVRRETDIFAVTSTNWEHDPTQCVTQEGSYLRVAWGKKPGGRGNDTSAAGARVAGVEVYVYCKVFSAHELKYRYDPEETELRGRLGAVRFIRRTGDRADLDVTLVVGYAPQNPSSQDDEDGHRKCTKFWEAVSRLLVKLPRRTIAICMLAANGKVAYLAEPRVV